MKWFKVEEKLEQGYSYSPGPVVLEVKFACFDKQEAKAARLFGLYPKAIVYDTVPLLGAVSYTDNPWKDKTKYGSNLYYYRMRLTKPASDIVNYLLSASSEWGVEIRRISRCDIQIRCWSVIPSFSAPLETMWYYYVRIKMHIKKQYCKIEWITDEKHTGTHIPLNCSILSPLWLKVVKQWEKKIRNNLGDDYTQFVVNKLLNVKFIDKEILQLFMC
ncbi:MAG: hypothetical protein QXQ68_05840 [Candidatus Nitrosocaldaceae archaeon]